MKTLKLKVRDSLRWSSRPLSSALFCRSYGDNTMASENRLKYSRVFIFLLFIFLHCDTLAYSILSFSPHFSFLVTLRDHIIKVFSMTDEPHGGQPYFSVQREPPLREQPIPVTSPRCDSTKEQAMSGSFSTERNRLLLRTLWG